MKKGKVVYLILGFGMGLVLSSIIYYFFPQVRTINLSDSEVIERARGLGYVSLKESIEVQKEEKEGKENKDTEQLKVSLENKDNISDLEEIEYIEVQIKEGDTLNIISNKLFTLGIIKDQREFIEFTEDKNLDTKFAYGTFKIDKDADYSEILKIVTK